MYVTIVAGLFLIAAISNGSGNPLTLLGSMLFLSPIWLLALAGLLALHARLDRQARTRLLYLGIPSAPSMRLVSPSREMSTTAMLGDS